MAERIQLRRTKGWRKPPGAVVVARPTKWGNPWRVVRDDAWTYRVQHVSEDRILGVFDDAATARKWAATGYWLVAPPVAEVRAALAGVDLACWCPLDAPCHADVLLAIANAEEPSRPTVGEMGGAFEGGPDSVEWLREQRGREGETDG